MLPSSDLFTVDSLPFDELGTYKKFLKYKKTKKFLNVSTKKRFFFRVSIGATTFALTDGVSKFQFIR
jgi:hypothetical protein